MLGNRLLSMKRNRHVRFTQDSQAGSSTQALHFQTAISSHLAETTFFSNAAPSFGQEYRHRAESCPRAETLSAGSRLESYRSHPFSNRFPEPYILSARHGERSLRAWQSVYHPR